ncbi:MAG: hypothetical protein L6R38_005652 [Xanthoria sp. 2 TBL-2021]|nr:MAG: hypothetical protein L6R38_005652 [Xanthoria sp. 2 TBL-2021]
MNNAGSSSEYKSQFCKIRAGPSEEAFYAHADVLKRSEVLKVQVEGSWKDIAGKDGIDWTSWNVNTVEKFLQWLYTGDYKCPYPTETRVSGEVVGGKTADEAYGGHQYGPAESHHDKAVVMTKDQVPETLPTGPLTPLKDLHWDGCQALGKLFQAEEFDKWTGHKLWASHQLNYEATFATHSELYVVACQYMLPELKNMAWQRLRSVLLTIGAPRQGSHVIKDLVGLITFVYKETTGGYGTHEPMRELLATFVALNLTNLRGSEEFGVLLSSNDPDDREFVAGLMAKVMQKMKDLEGKASKRPQGEPIVMTETNGDEYLSNLEEVDYGSPYGKKGRGKCTKCGRR